MREGHGLAVYGPSLNDKGIEGKNAQQYYHEDEDYRV